MGRKELRLIGKTVKSKTKDVPTFNYGDVIYTRTLQHYPGDSDMPAVLKGHACCLFICAVKPKAPALNKDQIHALLGASGLIQFDDIAEFLGEPVVEELIKKFEAKYYPEPEEGEEPLPIVAPEKPRILGPDGSTRQ